MPGIGGMKMPVNDAHGESRFRSMLGSMKHHPWYIEDAHFDYRSGVALGRVAPGLVNSAKQPGSNDDGSLVTVMEGELYNAEELRPLLISAGHQFASESNAEVLLHGYEKEGLAFFKRLNGQFAAAIWDKRKERLILVNDRFGIKPLYYATLPGKLLFASEIKALLVDPQVSRRTHNTGLAQFFTFGQLMNEDTLLEGVRLLPPAGCLVYDTRSDSLKVERYWQFEDQPKSNGADEANLERIDEVFKQAVDRRLQGTTRLGLALSGGLDARTILGVIDSDHLVKTITYGVKGGIDHSSAERMAQLAGQPHHTVLLDSDFLSDFERHMRRMVHLTDGHYLSQCIVMPTLPMYGELEIDVLLRGHAGELLHQDKAYNFSLDRQAWNLAGDDELYGWLNRNMRVHMLNDTVGELFAPTIQGEIDNLTRESVSTALRQSECLSSPVDRIAHMFLSQRIRRETSMSLVKFNSVVETRLPYLDNDLVDAVFAAPPRLRFADTMQAFILRRRRPDFLKIANANTGTRLGVSALRRTIAKARLKVFSKLRVPGYQPYERLGLWLRRELRPLVEKLLLSSRCHDRGIFNPTTLKAVVQHHLQGRSNHTYLLLALMIFELGQREFIDGDRHDTGGLELNRNGALGNDATAAVATTA